MANARKLALLDPTSLLGEELALRLVQAFPQVLHRYFHTRDSTDHLVVQVAGEASLVAPLRDLEELESVALVVITETPAPKVGQQLLAFLNAHPQLPCLDLSCPGVLSHPRGLLPPPGATRLAFLDPALLLPQKVLAALGPLQPRRAFFTVVAPVSALGGEAVDELAAQAVARLSGEQPKNQVLPTVTAFDALPYREKELGALEQQLVAQFPGLEVHLHPLLAGVFHAHCVLATVDVSLAPDPSHVRQLLGKAGFTLYRRQKPLTPSQAASKAQALVAILAVDGNKITLWAVGDHLLLQTAAACEAAALLLATGSPA
ncbi:MAG: Asd/ArgC dimerization domain-containing protein [Thermoanaerobaculum sp.]|nr:Asd/ArgC dimerization domain-containing protein [Thermoanaerobaculum sp.]